MAKRGHGIFKGIVRRNARCNKKHVKRVWKVSQNSVRDLPKPGKSEAWGKPGTQHPALKLHRAAKRQPRASEKCPRDAQEAPKRGQEPTKSEQKSAKWRSKASPNLPESTPRRVFGAIFAESAVRPAFGSISRRFKSRARSMRCVKTIQKPRKNCGFVA